MEDGTYDASVYGVQNLASSESHTYHIASKAGCPVIISNQLWVQIEKYFDFLKVFILILGAFLIFSGRLISGPANCMGGYLSTVAIASMIYALQYPDTLKA